MRSPRPDPDKFDPRFVPPRGCCSRPRLYIVGEAPGKDEADQQRPFVGQAGRTLDDLLAAARIDQSKVRFFNAIPYRPIRRSDDGKVANRGPSGRELVAFSHFLFEDIRATKPAAILAAGKSALGVFGISQPLRAARAQLFDFEGMPLRATYHPQYVRRFGGRGSSLWRLAVDDLKRSWRDADGG